VSPKAEDRLLTTEEVAARYPHVSASTVRYWRMKGTGPKGFLVGRRVLYRLSAVLAWEHQREAS
jgi:predicted DNA-binding transcriptional regulator AlpA